MSDPSKLEFVQSQPYDHAERAAEIAKERGCKVVYPGPRELFVDIDSQYSLEQFDKCLGVLQTIEQATITRKTPSPSGKPYKFHIVVELKRDLLPLERVLLQACLGSDPAREMLSLRRVLNKDQTPTLFFEKEEVPNPPTEKRMTIEEALRALREIRGKK